MISPETFPQVIKDNITGVEFPFHPINEAMVVSFKNGLDASVISGPTTHGAFEVAVGVVGLGVWAECPITEAEGITPDLDDEGVIALLAQIADFDSDDLKEARREMAVAETSVIVTAVQFGILRLAGLDENDDPFEYINGTDSEREALGLSAEARKALDVLSDLHLSALDRLTPKGETENDSE